MARSHLTLAALATSAVPGLDVAAARPFTTGAGGEFDSALVTDRDGRHLLVRVPVTDVARDTQAAELTALAALTPGVRSRLPFVVARVVGQAALRPEPGAAPSRAVVTEFVAGGRATLERIATGGPLASSVGAAIAAVHGLPVSVVVDAGLPVLGTGECQRTVTGLLDRAAATGHVPPPLLARWEGAAVDASLWQFQPAVIHNALGAESLLVDGPRGREEVTGVLGWSDLRVGDPARDLSWVLAAEDGAWNVLDAYTDARGGAADRQIRRRAMLYAELEIARWLLYGTEQGDAEIVDDAVDMLDGLLQNVEGEFVDSLDHETLPVLDVHEVRDLLGGGLSHRTADQPSVAVADSHGMRAQRRRSSSPE